MNTTTGNLILAALPESERADLLAGATHEKLQIEQVLSQPNQPIDHVYFLDDGIASVLSLFTSGAGVETATIGHEGMVGIALFLGAEQSASRIFMQVPGAGWRVPRAHFEDLIGRAPELRRQLGLFTQALITQTSQASACNRKHSMEQRCARWLLMVADRTNGHTFRLTQEFLSQMLGVRRASVTVAAGALQRAGMIEYSRGRVRITDRPRLESAACECYFIIRTEHERLLGNGGPAGASAVSDGWRA